MVENLFNELAQTRFFLFVVYLAVLSSEAGLENTCYCTTVIDNITLFTILFKNTRLAAVAYR